MEKEVPVCLTPATSDVRKRRRKVLPGLICIIHNHSTKDRKIKPCSYNVYQKVKDIAKTRLKETNEHYRLEHISSQIPVEYQGERHGYHRRCYQLFTNVSKLNKRKADIGNTEELSSPSTSKRRRTSGVDSSSSNTVLFPGSECLFCEKEVIKVKGAKHLLATCVTITAEQSIKDAATRKGDHVMLGKVEGQDLRAREARYHHHCRNKYTRGTQRNKHPILETTATDKYSIEAHEEAFKFLCLYIEEKIIVLQNVERLSMLREKYLAFIQEHFPDIHNENYKTYKLKDKLCKHFQARISFWQPSVRYQSQLVYAPGVEGYAVEAAFELAASDEKRLQESAMIIRRHIFEAMKSSPQMPWPPPSSWLLSNHCNPPDTLINFYKYLMYGKSTCGASRKFDRISNSLAEDVCYAVTNGKWAMPKHILLPMTVRHLTGNAELITILNRLGHAQSYTRTLDIETAMCNSISSVDSVLPANISVDNNAVLHLCWDNFDLNEETTSGSGTTHSTHGIVIQEVLDHDKCMSTQTPDVPKTKRNTVNPREIELQPCFARPKFEPDINISTSRPGFDFQHNALKQFIWFLTRKVGSSADTQTVPHWSGWLSQTSAQNKNIHKSNVEYMAPLNVSINDNATVQHILLSSLKASQEVGQEYAIVTFDLAVAKKAYALVWQYPEMFQKVVVRLGVFHTICSIFGTVGKMVDGSGLAEIVIESGICASGSLEKVLSGKHYNRALRVHKIFMESLERLLYRRFEEHTTLTLSPETSEIVKKLADNPSYEHLQQVESKTEFKEYFEKYQEFKAHVRKGHHGYTAKFWVMYIDIIHDILTVLEATKVNDLDMHIAALYKLCPLLFTFNHLNYARYLPAYLMLMMNIGVTHPGAEKLLRTSGFSVSRSAVPASRNAVDITIEQTINRHAKTKGGIIGFSRNYSAYYRWCMTRHMRAKYVEAILEKADMTAEDTCTHKEVEPAQIKSSEVDVQKVMTSIEEFINPFQVDMSKDKLYCLSSGVPASSEVADDLLTVVDTGQDLMEEFINRRFFEKSVPFHGTMKRNPVKTFSSIKKSKKITSSHNIIAQIRAERNVFGQLVLLAVTHDLDLELTLSFPLGPVPWALATSDGMPTKTDKAKLMHYVEESIQPTTCHPIEDVSYVIDGNALLQSLVTIPDTFGELADAVFQKLPKGARVDFITDTYYPNSIKSIERKRRGTAQTLLLAGPKTKTPRNWKEFMSNDDNKTQLIKLIFEQWSLQRFASKLHNRIVNFVIENKCYCLTSDDGVIVHKDAIDELHSSQEEADTRIILHCLNISSNASDTSTIIVRSPDTDVLILLAYYAPEIKTKLLFDTGVGNHRRLLDVKMILNAKGFDICSILPAIHAFTGCDTTSAFVRKGKVKPLKIIETHPEYIETLKELGQHRECSETLFDKLEAFVCCVYSHPEYTEINKVRYQMFVKKNGDQNGVLNSSDGIDMSLLPPCRKSLRMHVLRVNYQVYIWLHAHISNPHLPRVDDNGWSLDENQQLVYNWCDDNIVPEELIDIICNSDINDNSEPEDDCDLTNNGDMLYYEDLDSDEDGP